jgi:hypothetical protein
MNTHFYEFAKIALESATIREKALAVLLVRLCFSEDRNLDDIGQDAYRRWQEDVAAAALESSDPMVQLAETVDSCTLFTRSEPDRIMEV